MFQAFLKFSPQDVKIFLDVNVEFTYCTPEKLVPYGGAPASLRFGLFDSKPDRPA
jgi:hypothetical protein